MASLENTSRRSGQLPEVDRRIETMTYSLAERIIHLGIQRNGNWGECVLYFFTWMFRKTRNSNSDECMNRYARRRAPLTLFLLHNWCISMRTSLTEISLLTLYIIWTTTTDALRQGNEPICTHTMVDAETNPFKFNVGRCTGAVVISRIKPAPTKTIRAWYWIMAHIAPRHSHRVHLAR